MKTVLIRYPRHPFWYRVYLAVWPRRSLLMFMTIPQAFRRFYDRSNEGIPNQVER